MALESMRIVTGCKTPEQFVAAFHRFCDGKTCFVPSADTRPIGRALAFSLRLADGTPMLRGTCVVKAAWTTKANPFKRPGVLLEIEKLGAESEALFEYLLSQKTAVVGRSAGVVEAVRSATTNQHVPRDQAIDSILEQGNARVVRIPMKPPPLPDAARNVATDDDNPTEPLAVTRATADSATPTVKLPRLQDLTETRTPGSAFVLPANPLSDLDDDALDAMLGCTLDVDPDEPAPLPVLPAHDPIALLGAALKKATPPIPVVLRSEAVPQPVAGTGTQPLAFETRPPAARSMFDLRAMTSEERFWFLCAIGAALLVAAIVLASGFVFVS